MNLPIFLAADIPNPGFIAAVVAGIVLVVIIFFAVWASRYTKVAPTKS